MKVFATFICLASLVASLAGCMSLNQSKTDDTAPPAQATAQESPVWFWDSNQAGPKIKLEVQLDGKIIFTDRFSIARAKLSAIPDNAYAKKLIFSFTPGRPIAWKGYKDEVSSSDEKIECSIWLAGSEPSALILGVSFNKQPSILLNTVAITSSTEQSKSSIADGLVVITTPVD